MADLSTAIHDLEEFEVWKKNSTFMYKMLDFHTLDWPSLTCQWLPTNEKTESGHLYQLLLGTHTDTEDNKLLIYNVIVSENDLESEDGKRSQYSLQARFEECKSMVHEGHVNRARYMPQDSSVVATRSSGDDCYVYHGDGVLTLKGHTTEGYGMSWSGIDAGRLLTAGGDRQICLWDVNSGRSVPLVAFNGPHDDKVEDAAWHPLDAGVLGSVGDDGALVLLDVRARQWVACGRVLKAHTDDTNCIAWHPSVAHLVLTGGGDGRVALWDMRTLARPLHEFETEDSKAVFRAEWAAAEERVFVSCGDERHVRVWDVGGIGAESMSREEEGGASELRVVYGGHRAVVSDVAWHPAVRGLLATVDVENELSVWHMNEKVFECY